ncbi:MAG: retention module-containing protein [Desulfobulbus sp.]
MASATHLPIGKVFLVYGTVKAVSPAGVERILGPNSIIYADDRIVTGPDGSISITLNGQEHNLTLGRMSDVLLDTDVYGGGQAAEPDAVAQVEDIQAALEDGTFDPTTDLPAPAAGAGVGAVGLGARGGGRQIVVFTADQNELLPDSGAETTGIGYNFLDPPPGAFDDELPGASVAADGELPGGSVPAVAPEGLTVEEANDLGRPMPGSLNINPGADGLGSVELSASGATWNADDRTLAADDGSWTLRVLDDGGNYTFTQHKAMTHPDPNDPNDSLPIDITVTVTDGDGDSASGEFTINVFDDGPVVAPEGLPVYESSDLNKSLPGSLNINYGADGFGSLELSASGATWNAGTLAADDGSWILQVEDDAGNYTFTLREPLTHHPEGSEFDDFLPIEITVTVTDGDGDSDSGKFTINVFDDEPSFGVPQNIILTNEAGNEATASLAIDFGADGAAAINGLQLLDATGASLAGQPVVDIDGTPLTSNGNPLVYQENGAGGVEAVDSNGNVVFEVVVDPVQGTYSLILSEIYPVDSATEVGGGAFTAGTEPGTAVYQFADGINIVASSSFPNHGVHIGPDGLGIDARAGSGGDADPAAISGSELLILNFLDAAGQSQDMELSGFTLQGLGGTYGRGGVFTPEEASYSLYNDGALIGTYTVLGDPSGTVNVNFPANTVCDQVVFGADTKATMYQVQELTFNHAGDHVLSYRVQATDQDGDTDSTSVQVTLDANGTIVGSDAPEVIVGGSGDDVIHGGGGDDIIDGGAGNDSLFGDAGADSFLQSEYDAGEVMDFGLNGDLDQLLGPGGGSTS